MLQLFFIRFNEMDTQLGVDLARSLPAAKTLRSYPNEGLTGREDQPMYFGTYSHSHGLIRYRSGYKFELLWLRPISFAFGERSKRRRSFAISRYW